MKNISAPLLAHLQTGGPFVMADLYTVTLASGAIYHWADFDQDIVHPTNGYTYSSTGPVLKRGKTREIIGIEVDTLDISIYGRGSDSVNGLPILAAAQAGAFDGATLILERAFLSPIPTVVGTVILFTGRFADVTLGRTEFQVRVNSLTESLNINLPRNIQQPGCTHVLYDAGCGLTKSTFGTSGTIATGSTTSILNSGITNSFGYFNRGSIKFTSGALTGITRTIKSYNLGVFSLLLPLPTVPVVGDSFIAYAGCDKQQSTCSSKFGNIAQFRGAPFIPVPVTAV